MRRRGHPHGLFVRIYLHGVLLIVALAVAIGAVFWAFGGPPTPPVVERLGAQIGATIAPEGEPQTALLARLQDLHDLTDARLAVYALSGERLAAMGDNPPAPLEQSKLERLEKNPVVHGRGGRVSVKLTGGVRKAYIVAEWKQSHSPAGFFVGLALSLMVIGAISWPLARAVARPLEKLTGTARRLAEGDLTARTGFDRHDQLGVLARTMDEMAERLEQHIRGEKELLANVSHELRTPLARIKTALELVGLPETTEAEIREQLEGIAGDSAELEQLIEDVMTVSRLEIGDGKSGLVLRTSEIPIAELANQSAARWATLRGEPRLEVDVGADLPPVTADPHLLRRALDNLLDNAAKYSPGDEPVTLAAKLAPGGGVSIEVRDRGIGIADEERGRIFEPFYRTEKSRSRAGGGTGLGLTLARRVVEAHHGTIEALPRDGGGTIFQITLPTTS